VFVAALERVLAAGVVAGVGVVAVFPTGVDVDVDVELVDVELVVAGGVLTAAGVVLVVVLVVELVVAGGGGGSGVVLVVDAGGGDGGGACVVGCTCVVDAITASQLLVRQPTLLRADIQGGTTTTTVDVRGGRSVSESGVSVAGSGPMTSVVSGGGGGPNENGGKPLCCRLAAAMCARLRLLGNSNMSIPFFCGFWSDMDR
jgi:hypothetical protein